MLGENIQNLRKQKGLTQEELAIRLHVVRQTVSKWEKGLSVPDAETIQKIAEELDAPLGQLLGADVPVEENKNEVAEQLARINEQLAIKNRRARRIWKVIAGIFVASVLLMIISISLFGVASKGPVTYTDYLSATVVEAEEEYFIIEVTEVDDEEMFGSLIGRDCILYKDQVSNDETVVVGDEIRLVFSAINTENDLIEFDVVDIVESTHYEIE